MVNVPQSLRGYQGRTVGVLNHRARRAHREIQKLNLSADYLELENNLSADYADFRRFKKLILRAIRENYFRGIKSYQ